MRHFFTGCLCFAQPRLTRFSPFCVSDFVMIFAEEDEGLFLFTSAPVFVFLDFNFCLVFRVPRNQVQECHLVANRTMQTSISFRAIIGILEEGVLEESV